ncbi:MAG: hypothetical protein QGD96_13505, partial [Anaerolineae bacterium]|nr:hypothetical protein [Anaerolineae bacterium]
SYRKIIVVWKKYSGRDRGTYGVQINAEGKLAYRIWKLVHPLYPYGSFGYLNPKGLSYEIAREILRRKK